MDLKLRNLDSIRVIGDHKENNFINISSVGYNSLAIVYLVFLLHNLFSNNGE